ncbi:hypothetical protein CR513_35642, partial [Mucuna pruriens]
MVTVQTLLVVAATQFWILHQMNVHNAFLHSDLPDEVYMQLLLGFSYGDSQQVILTVLVYVDDLIIPRNNKDVIEGFKSYLSTCFYIKDTGNLKYSLGLKYALDIILETGLLGANLVGFPLKQNHRLTLPNGVILEDLERYRQLVGRLIYMTISRPKLSYFVHILAQFMQCPQQEHWEVATFVVRYLKGNPFLHYDSDLTLYAYCDLDWTRYFVFLEKSLISWKTKKQVTVSFSLVEDEYRSMATTISELKWLKALLVNLQVPYLQPIQTTIYIVTNLVFHERTKHIKVDCHYIRDEIQDDNIVTMHV